MTPEQKAALDRLLRHEAITGMDFRESPYFVEGRGVDESLRLPDVRIAMLLCLAEHPADDDEPVTEEWLRSVGFCDTEYMSSLENGPLEYVLEEEVYFPENWILNGGDPPESMSIKTRGDVRRLCRALGIQLNEPAAVPHEGGDVE